MYRQTQHAGKDQQLPVWVKLLLILEAYILVRRTVLFRHLQSIPLLSSCAKQP